MSNLITSTEVITLAFNRSVEADKIKDYDITAAQWKYIKPVLTNDLYKDVIDNESNYTTLINDYIKPCLAYYVKYMVAPELMFTLSDRGSFIETAGDTNTMTDEQRRKYADSLLEKANQLAGVMTDYIIKQELLEYTRTDDSKPQIIGGLLIKNYLK